MVDLRFQPVNMKHLRGIFSTTVKLYMKLFETNPLTTLSSLNLKISARIFLSNIRRPIQSGLHPNPIWRQ